MVAFSESVTNLSKIWAEHCMRVSNYGIKCKHEHIKRDHKTLQHFFLNKKEVISLGLKMKELFIFKRYVKVGMLNITVDDIRGVGGQLTI